GCAYVYPDLGTRGSGTVITWMRDQVDRVPLLTVFNDVFMGWITAYLPAGGEYALTTNADF
ncbi:MAG: hypothetical protein MRY67_14105, partial [Rhodovulum sp.]|nr:hypothetical protein [Rhodovulum sp.]